MPLTSLLLRRADGGAIETDRPSSASPPLHFAVRILLLSVAYYMTVRLGFALRFPNSQIGIVWPATAIMVAALLLTWQSRWWVIFAATGVAHALAVDPALPDWRLVWQVLGNAVFALVVVMGLRRFAGHTLNFQSRRQVIAFLVVAFGATALFVFTTPSFVRSVMGLESFSPSTAFGRVYLVNVTGLLLLSPVALLWWGYWDHHPARWVGEAVLIGALLIAAGGVVFGSGRQLASEPWILLLMLLPLLWAAMRFGPRGASLALLAVAIMSAWGAAVQAGPFGLFAGASQVLSLHVFWIVLWIPVMLLAAASRERLAAEREVEEKQRQLAHLTRVATAGELSGALAHELRQPLTAIMLSAEAARIGIDAPAPDVSEMREMLDIIIDQNKHAAGVISRLQAFVKSGTPQFHKLLVEDVVRDAVSLARGPILSAQLTLETSLPAGLPAVQGERVQLMQVLLNLIMNASDAMRAAQSPVRRLRISAARRDATRVDIAVCDTGSGLKDTERVFESFFTTKEKGMGLGLAISRAIAEAHGGRLWAENNTGPGATFHLELPIAR